MLSQATQQKTLKDGLFGAFFRTKLMEIYLLLQV